MTTSIYRKYRPKTLEKIIGQKNIVEILKNEAIEKKFSNAYLFYGPRGTGKTSTARIMAKLANCREREKNADFAKKGEPCNKCEACQSIDAGNALDVIEIDAASTRGVEDVRKLQENIVTLPFKYPYKIIIMDEIHMLTQQAFNALLKTIEEPPAHIIFVFATTEYEKVPITIVSRTQKFHFKKVSIQNIIDKLQDIVKEENIESSEEGLEMIARLSEGSMRDAESILGQISSMKGKITESNVEDIAGKTSYAKIGKMADYITKKDIKSSLELLYKIQQDGYNLHQFNKDLTEYLRRILSLSLNPDLENLFSYDLSKSEIKNIKEYAQNADTKLLVSIIKGLISAYAQMKYNPLPVIPLEVAIITALSINK